MNRLHKVFYNLTNPYTKYTDVELWAALKSARNFCESEQGRYDMALNECPSYRCLEQIEAEIMRRHISHPQ